MLEKGCQCFMTHVMDCFYFLFCLIKNFLVKAAFSSYYLKQPHVSCKKTCSSIKVCFFCLSAQLFIKNARARCHMETGTADQCGIIV